MSYTTYNIVVFLQSLILRLIQFTTCHTACNTHLHHVARYHQPLNGIDSTTLEVSAGSLRVRATLEVLAGSLRGRWLNFEKRLEIPDPSLALLVGGIMAKLKLTAWQRIIPVLSDTERSYLTCRQGGMKRRCWDPAI